MATKKKEEKILVDSKPKFKGYQILKLPRYNNRVSRVVIKEDEYYSLEEVDNLISDFMKKKG